jgi:asparagine synthase (glutamine-hydrolysing)
MCGIAGFYYRDEKPVDPAIVRRMTDQLIHRGPDDSGVWVERNIGLGHRRLSIRDLSSAGRQPMLDPTGRVVVSFNGEIYNDQELRRELQEEFGFSFHTQTDTELLPLGYLAWGEGLFDRLEGMFAIALWDRQQQRLLLARDGIGIKPLYYLADTRKVLFGSELKAILASGQCERKIDSGSLHTYFAAGFPGPGSSLVQGVAQVRPGTFLSFANDSYAESIFWRPSRSGKITNLEQALDEFSHLFPPVLKSQLVSDVPLSVFQSGGIDSTLVSLTAKNLNASPPLFTAGFADGSHDESGLASDVARVAGLEHHTLRVDKDDDPVATFRDIAYHFDGQCADTGSYAFYRLCGEVRKHCTVVMAGDGGDEFFGGYDTYRASQVAEALTPMMPSSLMGLIGRVAYSMRASDESRLPISAVASRFCLGLAAGKDNAHMQWRRLVPDFLLPSLYGTEMRSYIGTSPYLEYETCADGDYANSLDRWLLSDQRFHIQSVLAKVDAMSMAHGLEVRVPLLDRRIMDFAGRCSAELLLPKNGPRKYLLRKAAERLGAPESVLNAKKKGFNVPIAKMLRNELAPLANYWLLSNPDILSPYINPDAISALCRDHIKGKANHAFVLWPLLILAEWLGGGKGREVSKHQTRAPGLIQSGMTNLFLSP